MAFKNGFAVTGNSTLTIDNIEGTGQPQWVSFYYHNPDGLCTCSPFHVGQQDQQI